MKVQIVALVAFAAFTSALPTPATEMEWKAIYGSYPIEVLRERTIPLVLRPELQKIEIVPELAKEAEIILPVPAKEAEIIVPVPAKEAEIIVPVLPKEAEVIVPEADKKPEIEKVEYILPEAQVKAYIDPEEFYRTFNFYPQN